MSSGTVDSTGRRSRCSTYAYTHHLQEPERTSLAGWIECGPSWTSHRWKCFTGSGAEAARGLCRSPSLELVAWSAPKTSASRARGGSIGRTRKYEDGWATRCGSGDLARRPRGSFWANARCALCHVSSLEFLTTTHRSASTVRNPRVLTNAASGKCLGSRRRAAHSLIMATRM